MYISKLGQKSVRMAGKFGMKELHTGAKLGSKLIVPAGILGSLLAPELAVPIMAGAKIARPILNEIQKATK